MSEFHVEVAKITKIRKHSNADTLSIGEINGYPVIFKNDLFQDGDLAVHIPIDSIVPDSPEWAFLNGDRRIKAKRLRGIFSMGMVIPPQPGWKRGQNVQHELGIIKWEPLVDQKDVVPPKTGWRRCIKKWTYRVKSMLGMPVTTGPNESDPGFLPVYTDIEGYRKYRDVLIEGEEVIITEKIHGQNGRFLFHNKRLWIGSHYCIKQRGFNTNWAQVAKELDLQHRLAKVPGIAIYGELYGNVQDLKYGVSGIKLMLFDAMDINTKRYLNYDDFKKLAAALELPTVPEIFRGPWTPELAKLAEGKSIHPGANHVREGIVIKPTIERYDNTIGRVILKNLGEAYLLRKS
jgi:tRNA-binding EMAP/Myf-like protein